MGKGSRGRAVGALEEAGKRHAAGRMLDRRLVEMVVAGGFRAQESGSRHPTTASVAGPRPLNQHGLRLGVFMVHVLLTIYFFFFGFGFEYRCTALIVSKAFCVPFRGSRGSRHWSCCRIASSRVMEFSHISFSCDIMFLVSVECTISSLFR